MLEEDEHLDWARTMKARIVQLQATSGVAASAAMKTEELVATVRNWFSSRGHRALVVPSHITCNGPPAAYR